MAQVRRIPSLSTGSSLSLDRPQAAKVLRNTYALLSLTILFAAGIAALAVLTWTALRLPDADKLHNKTGRATKIRKAIKHFLCSWIFKQICSIRYKQRL